MLYFALDILYFVLLFTFAVGIAKVFVWSANRYPKMMIIVTTAAVLLYGLYLSYFNESVMQWLGWRL